MVDILSLLRKKELDVVFPPNSALLREEQQSWNMGKVTLHMPQGRVQKASTRTSLCRAWTPQQWEVQPYTELP